MGRGDDVMGRGDDVMGRGDDVMGVDVVMMWAIGQGYGCGCEGCVALVCFGIPAPVLVW